MTTFVAYKRNLLTDYNIQSVSIKVECATIIEAAMAYFTKHGEFPNEIYSEEPRKDMQEAYEGVCAELREVRRQRDNFANSLGVLENERWLCVQHINTLHDYAQKALAAANLPLGGENA